MLSTTRGKTAKTAKTKRARPASPRSELREYRKNSNHAEAPPDLYDLVRSLVRFKPTNLEKVLYPEQGLTKGALLGYLAVARDWMLPHIARRPLTLVRCPEGRHKHCFFQKHAAKTSAPSIKNIPIREDDGTTAEYLMVEDLEGLLATAQLGALELHTWGCHYPTIEKPDVLVFDLDPDVDLPWNAIAAAAFDLRGRLREVGLESLVKTTGGKGLHVVAPVSPRLEWDAFKNFSKDIVTRMERAEPKRFTTNMLKAKRRGRIFLDYLRNGRGATFIAPYSTRAREGAPVATPITWEELANGVDPLAFTALTVPRRLASLKKDPWSEYSELSKQRISAAALKEVRAR